jgi:hypothetical protein
MLPHFPAASQHDSAWSPRPIYLILGLNSQPIRKWPGPQSRVSPAASDGSDSALPALLMADHVDDHRGGQQQDGILSGFDFDAVGVGKGEPAPELLFEDEAHEIH